MPDLIPAAAIFCVLAFAVHLSTVATAIARLRASRDEPPPHFSPAVSVIRPVCGMENFVEETLESSFHLDHPRFEVIFCVAHGSDPVVALLRRLMAKHAHVPARLLVGNDAISGNPKLNNFAKGWTAASHEWIVVSDSNALLPRDCIQRLLARWDFRTGLVCSPPVGAHPIGIWAELECAFLNTYQARWQCFADAIGFGFAQGKTMLWRRDFLDEAGGVRALAAELAEDAAATKLVRHAGLHVRLVNAPFAQPLGERTASEVWNRQLRWSRLRRDAFKAYFALEILSGGAPALLAGGVVAAAAGWPLPAALIALATLWYGAEAVLAYAAGWHLTRRSPLLWLARDSMLPVLWTISWLGNAFVWRGHEMRVADRTSPA